MLRQTLLYLSTARWARRTVTQWGLARRVALRFVAGETMDDALRVIRALNEKGLLVSLDYLGESVSEADRIVNPKPDSRTKIPNPRMP